MFKKFQLIVCLLLVVCLSVSAWAMPSNINWKQFKGQTLVVSVCVHNVNNGIKPKLAVFEKLTGAKVIFNELPEEEFYKKTTIELSSGKPSFDVFMLNQGSVAQYVEAKWLEPLKKYLENPKLTDKKWFTIEDYSAAALKRPTYKGILYGIPITVDPQIMFYRKDLLEAAGLPVPATLDELYETAGKIAKANPGVAGIINRLRRGAGSYWPWLGMVSAYQGQWVDENNKVHLTDPETVAATKMYINLLKDCGPEAALNFGWYECLAGFQQGKAAFLMDANSWIANFQDPKTSKVAGKVGCAVMPAGPNGYVQAAGGASWMLAIPNKSAEKNLAWAFIQWVTKDQALEIALSSGNVARKSIWTNPAFTKAFPYPDWIKASSETTAKYNDTYYLASITKLNAIGEIIDIALEQIYMGTPAEEVLAKAQKETEDILK